MKPDFSLCGWMKNRRTLGCARCPVPLDGSESRLAGAPTSGSPAHGKTNCRKISLYEILNVK
jgi:hypothetical protein